MNENLILPARPTLMQRINDRLEARRSGESGLALLDVLLGMAIFALIVIIAIQSVGQFRQRAFQTAATSDAQQVSIGLEGFFTDNQAYPTPSGTGVAATISGTDMTAMGVNLTKNVVVTGYTKDDDAGTYTFCTLHKSGGNTDAWAIYEADKGAVTSSGRGSAPSSCE